MNANMKKTLKPIGTHLFLAAFGFIMVFPIIYLLFGTFKNNTELFTSPRLLPESFSPDSYINGWNANTQYTFTTFFKNTFVMTIPTVLFTIISCSLVAYGFARFRFTGSKMMFSVMIATLMLPNSVIIIPRYIVFSELKWLNTFLPFYIPALFACYPFHVFMLIQFLRGIPRELDESASIDGCGPFMIFVRILLPLIKPALFTVGLLQTMTIWNDFFNPLIYINSVRNYPLSLALRMSLDMGAEIPWANVLAMALLSILPLIIIFFSAQKYFVEGIATTGLKG